ncbi:MAG: gamma-glutamylcyclotransferase family protein [bacterium]
MTEETACLFCYGSLQLPAVMKIVTGREFTGQPAWLKDFAMFRMKQAEYPGIIPRSGDTVGGILYRNLTKQDLRSLDAFEGEQYDRRQVIVSLEGDLRQTAWVYVVREERQNELTDETWTLSQFMANDYEQFMTRFVLGRRDLFT